MDQEEEEEEEEEVEEEEEEEDSPDLGSNFRFLYFRGLLLKSETKTPLFLSNFKTGSF